MSTDESAALWDDLRAARGPSAVASDRDVAQLNDEICAQLSGLWRQNSSARWLLLDGAGATDACGESGVRCDAQRCVTRSFRLRLYQVRVMRDQERVAVERMIARSANQPHLYLGADAIELARRTRLITTAAPCAVHACIEELCLLHVGATTRAAQAYNRLHTDELVGAADTVYLCLRHERFHVCDAYCDQTDVGRSGERVCALSQIVKTAPEGAFTFGDGTARLGDVDVATSAPTMPAGWLQSVTHEDMEEVRQFGSGPASEAAPRRATYGESDVLRERGSLVGRRRGRGHGSVIGGELRSQRDRLALASVAARSTGDDGALTPDELARQFADAARSVANVPTNESASQPTEGGARQRKARRAKRHKEALRAPTAHTTLLVPQSTYRLLIDNGDNDGGDEQLVLSALNETGERVLVTLNVRATLPFGERTPHYNDAFLRDVIDERGMRAVRRARFRGSGAYAAAFGTARLFERCGERACAIFARLFNSHERTAIEHDKDAAGENRLRIELEAYGNERKRVRKPVLIEDYQRMAHTVRQSTIAFKRLVIDDTLWALIETYDALLVTEFYFGMRSFVTQFCDRFAPEVVDAVQVHFHFEHFVPVILFLMTDGFELNGVTVLPTDRLIVHEWFPETATLRHLGIPEPTMTHLCTTVRAYIATAREIKTSLRRLEATQLETEQLMALRLPLDDSPPLDDSRAFAEHAAAALVRLFLARRSARIAALSHQQ